MPYQRLWFQLSVLVCLYSAVYALSFDLPEESVQVVGQLNWVQAAPGDSFHTVGRQYGVGYHEMMEANPGLSNDKISISPGTIIILPTRFILPAPSRKGIVINLAELRLYYYDKDVVYTYPIGIGRAGWDTPLGRSYILEKLKDPVWRVPQSIKEASKKEGVILPDRIPSGEDNPLGPYALRLHYHNYLIHGTNEVEGVGRRSTAGCIRMFPEDIQELFSKVTQGMRVEIVNEPYKVGWDAQAHLHLEAHLPLTITDAHSSVVQKYINQLISQAVKNKKTAIIEDWVPRILKETMGIPIVVGHLEN